MVKTQTDEEKCKKEQIKELRKEIRTLKKKGTNLRKKKPLEYRNSNENLEIVLVDSKIKELKKAIDLLKYKPKKKSKKSKEKKK